MNPPNTMQATMKLVTFLMIESFMIKPLAMCVKNFVVNNKVTITTRFWQVEWCTGFASDLDLCFGFGCRLQQLQAVIRYV